MKQPRREATVSAELDGVWTNIGHVFDPIIEFAQTLTYWNMSARTGISPAILAEFYRLWAEDRKALDGDSGSLDWDREAFVVWMEDFKPVSPTLAERWRMAKFSLEQYAPAIFWTSFIWLSFMAVVAAFVWR